MKVVYVIVSPSHDFKDTLRAFSTKKLAETYMSNLRGNNYIEVVPVDFDVSATT